MREVRALSIELLRLTSKGSAERTLDTLGWALLVSARPVEKMEAEDTEAGGVAGDTGEEKGE